MNQTLLDFHFTYKSPMQYPGGKFYGARHICRYIPYTDAIVAPFCGGASVELRLTCRGTLVHAYDAFEPLINAWNYIQTDSECIYQEIEAIFQENYADKEYFKNMQDTYYDFPTDREKAIAFLVLNRAIYNGIVFQRKHSVIPLYKREDGKIYRQGTERRNDRLVVTNLGREFNNPLIKFKVSDFRESLAKHSDLLAYLDPPYPNPHEYYGDSPEYHSLFPHEELAEILYERTSPWVMSYSNVPFVRDLYSDKDFLYAFPTWNQGMRKENKSNEVLIAPRNMGLEEFFDEALPA